VSDPATQAFVQWLMAPGASEFDELIVRPGWQTHAACRGEPVEVFFPEKGAGTYDRARCGRSREIAIGDQQNSRSELTQ